MGDETHAPRGGINARHFTNRNQAKPNKQKKIKRKSNREEFMRRLVLTGLSAIICALTGAASFAQDTPVQLKFAHWVPTTHPVHAAAQAWLASIEKASNGTITGTIYPAQQLGKAFDHYNMARDGIADLTYINPGYQPGRFPIIAAGELPFLISNATGGTAALDSWYRKYAASEMKDV